MLSFSSCETDEGQSPRIHFILESNFRGIFQIAETAGGQKLVAQNGAYTIRIPKNGLAQVESLGPFIDWHKVSASYSNGRPLSVAYSVDQNEIALRRLDTTSKGVMWWVVGTGQRQKELLEKGVFFVEEEYHKQR